MDVRMDSFHVSFRCEGDKVDEARQVVTRNVIRCFSDVFGAGWSSAENPSSMRLLIW